MYAKCQIIGRIGNVKKYDGFTRASVAVNRRRSGEDVTDWFEVVFFSKNKEIFDCLSNVVGKLFFIEGQPRSNTKDKIIYWSVAVDRFLILERKGNREDREGGEDAPPAEVEDLPF